MYFDNNQGAGVNYFSATQTGAWTGSDRRIKTNINPIRPVLQDILKLNPVSFQLRNRDLSEPPADNPYDYHFIAQEVEQHIPELVSIVPSDLFPDRSPLRTMGGNMNAFLVKAIQEQQQLITALQTQVQQLQQRLG
jgi:hypothetical protein